METENTSLPFFKDNPVVTINAQDFETFILKFGALLHTLYNKNVNPTFLFLTLIKDDALQSLLQTISGISTNIELFKLILVLYPNLLKSKIVRENSIKYVKQKKINLKRKLKYSSTHPKKASKVSKQSKPTKSAK